MKTTKEITSILTCPDGYYFLEYGDIISKDDLWIGSPNSSWNGVTRFANNITIIGLTVIKARLTVTETHETIRNNFQFCRKIIPTTKNGIDLLRGLFIGRKCLHGDDDYKVTQIYLDYSNVVVVELTPFDNSLSVVRGVYFHSVKFVVS